MLKEKLRWPAEELTSNIAVLGNLSLETVIVIRERSWALTVGYTLWCILSE
jgi:hypothetical protein